MQRFSFKKFILFFFIGLIILGFLPFGEHQPIQYISRDSGKLKTEKVPGEGWLYWLYNNPLGEISLETMVKRKFLSEWYGKQMEDPSSKEKIAPFIEEYGIDMSIAQKQEFENFNDFFYRKLKPTSRPLDNDSLIITSPADGKVLVYENIKDQDFIVKGYRFNLHKFLRNDSISKIFEEGSLMIIRLCPTDYHRYHFPIDGEVTHQQKETGDYYSVSPIALREKIELISMNKRDFTIIESKEFGPVIMSEVAATMVGSMVDTYEGNNVNKGQEKGYFKFGGSTVVLIFKKNQILIDPDLIENTKNNLETEIKMGEKIARFKSQKTIK